MKAKGSMRATWKKGRQVDSKTNTEVEFDEHTVLNDRYLLFPNGLANPTQYQMMEHANTEDVSHQEKSNYHVFSPPDVFLYGFGTGASTIREAVAPSSSYAVLRAERRTLSDGRDCFAIEKVRLDDYMKVPDTSEATFIVDPSRGYLVTEVVFRNRNGELWVSNENELSEVQPGVWFPTKITEKRYGKSSSLPGEAKLTDATDISVSDITVSPPPSDQVFTAEGLAQDLGVPLWSLLIWRDENGTFTPVMDYQGHVVSRDAFDAVTSIENQVGLPPAPEKAAEATHDTRPLATPADSATPVSGMSTGGPGPGDASYRGRWSSTASFAMLAISCFLTALCVRAFRSRSRKAGEVQTRLGESRSSKGGGIG